MKNEKFTLKQDHLTLLNHMWVGWSDSEYGAPEIDPKRPYGNSDVARDVADLLGWEYDDDEGLTDKQRKTADELHSQTGIALQIILATQSFKLGTYVKKDKYDDRSWELE